jgi:hypothetical protein
VITAHSRVWYAAYGSNMHAERFACYLRGGRPPGGARTYPGCRDPRAPERQVPVVLPGQMYFAWESAVWTGGMAFYDPTAAGTTPGRAYLVTAQQFADVAAQEMHREPGADLDVDLALDLDLALTEVLAQGTAQLGPGRYETLVCPGHLDGLPLLTFTAPWRIEQAPLNPPSPAYLQHLAAGLAETHGWPPDRIAAYLSTRPGAANMIEHVQRGCI